MSKDSSSWLEIIKHFILLAVVFFIFRWYIKGMFGKYWYLFWGYLAIVVAVYIRG